MKYKRILLKLSGEILGGEDGKGLDEIALKRYADEIAAVSKKGVQVAIVVGGGNIFRGLSGVGKGYDRVKGDQMGMLATIINSLALSQAIRSAGVPAEVFSSTPMKPIVEYFVRDKAVELLEKGTVVIIGGGTGNPFFTTDSASALRACEIGADALLKGTKVDGVYNADPAKDPAAVKYLTLSFDKALADNLKVMDSTAFALCKDNGMKIVVFEATKEGNLLKLIDGEEIGTIVS